MAANQRHQGKHVLAGRAWHESFPTETALKPTHLNRHSELELTTIVLSLQFCLVQPSLPQNTLIEVYLGSTLAIAGNHTADLSQTFI